jgi:hypothetical protein
MQKPFKIASEAMTKETNGKFQKLITPKGMRRTSKDLVRNRVPAGDRVVYRTNPRGEHVVAVSWPPESS